MKKLIIILGALALIVVVGVVILTFSLGGIVTKTVNTFGPKLTKSPVTLASANISPISGSGTLTGLFVGNPPGWSSEKAFFLGKIHVDVVPSSLMGDHLIIEEVIIDQPEFVYETKIVSSNIKDLLKNVEEYAGSSESKPADPAAKPIKITIKRFVLQNAKVTLGVGPAAITVPMPPLTLTDLGTKEGGLTPAQLSVKVMQSVLADVAQAAIGALTKAGGASGASATDAISGAAKKAGESLKGLFGGEKKNP